MWRVWDAVCGCSVASTDAGSTSVAPDTSISCHSRREKLIRRDSLFKLEGNPDASIDLLPHWAFHPIRRPSPSPHWAADTFHSIIWRVVDLHLQSPMHGFFSLLSSLWPADFKFDLIPVKNIACLSIQWVQIIFRQLVWSWSDIQLQMESQNKCWLVSICFADDLKSLFFNT